MIDFNRALGLKLEYERVEDGEQEFHSVYLNNKFGDGSCIGYIRRASIELYETRISLELGDGDNMALQFWTKNMTDAICRVEWGVWSIGSDHIHLGAMNLLASQEARDAIAR